MLCSGVCIPSLFYVGYRCFTHNCCTNRKCFHQTYMQKYMKSIAYIHQNAQFSYSFLWLNTCSVKKLRFWKPTYLSYLQLIMIIYKLFFYTGFLKVFEAIWHCKGYNKNVFVFHLLCICKEMRMAGSSPKVVATFVIHKRLLMLGINILTFGRNSGFLESK